MPQPVAQAASQPLQPPAAEQPTDQRAGEARRAGRRASASRAGSSSGPMRAPRSDRQRSRRATAAPTMNPSQWPASAERSATSATMIQSSAVTGGRAGYPPRRRRHAGAVSRGGRTGRATSVGHRAWRIPSPVAGAPPSRPLAAPGRRARPVRGRLRRRPRRGRPPHAGRRRPTPSASRPRGSAATTRRCTPSSPPAIASACRRGALHGRLPGRAEHGHGGEGRHGQAAQGRQRLPRARPHPAPACSAPSRACWSCQSAARGDTMRIAWRENAVFPGRRSGEELRRTTTMPPRAAILARDRPLAHGDERASPLGSWPARWSEASARSPTTAARG